GHADGRRKGWRRGGAVLNIACSFPPRRSLVHPHEAVVREVLRALPQWLARPRVLSADGR
ncbi:MAG TPA: hypothetical protein VF142_00575, partial [Longimicrobium sp.]